MTHTPGPWKVTPHGDNAPRRRNRYVIEHESGMPWIANVADTSVSRKDGEANARLIAKAPEMKKIVFFVATWSRKKKGCHSETCGHQSCQIVREARALLREIEG